MELAPVTEGYPTIMLDANGNSRYATRMGYTIRELHGSEVSQAIPETIPFPELAMAKAAYDKDGSMIGYALFQLVPHVDGFWVRPDARGGSVTRALADAITDTARSASDYYISLATNPFVDQLCERAGMLPIPGHLYMWRRDG